MPSISTDLPANTSLPLTPTSDAVPTITPQLELAFLEKPSPNHLRVMSYNVNWDSIFPDGDPQNHDFRSAERVDAFRRVITAISPDILCLQEINPERDPAQISTILGEILPLESDKDWQAISVRDTVIAARYDLLDDEYKLFVPPGITYLPQAAALIDLPDALYNQVDVYIICTHFKASGGNANIGIRQIQADAIARQVEDFKTPGGDIDLPQSTPYILLGDFNIYDTDPAYHLTTLLTGDVINEIIYGEDVLMDWDGTSITDVLPSHNGIGEAFYTWRDDSSSFNPGTLDRIIYSDSVLQVGNAFVLNTMILSQQELDAIGLRVDDVMVNGQSGYYDHFPLVVDFILIED